MDWGAVGVGGGGFVALAASAWAITRWVHRHIVWPLRVVLGVDEKNSLNGEEVPPLPQQLAGMRRSLALMQSDVTSLKRVVLPNGGKSIADKVASTDQVVHDTQASLFSHLTEAERDSRLLHEHLRSHE